MSERSSHKSAPSPPAPAPPSPGSSLTGKSGGESSGAPSGSDGQMTIISSRQPLPRVPIGRDDSPLETRGLLEGEQLGQFLLEKFVGGGGMGVVFRALDTTLNRQVAVKVLSRDQSADEETLRRFRNEAQSAARLNHENIARVHYVGEDRGVHYIVFEFIEGVNIRDLVERDGPLPLDDAISFTYQIAQALEHASQRAVIHRDIKPSNVLITPDGKAKLVDMGLARLNQVAQADNDLTASGVTLGTFDYISPEQARDPRSADVRSDLYSLGCSFFYMLTGRPPFPDGTVLQKLLQHQADHPPDPRAVRPELPSDVARILARLLSKNPAHRYQQAEELSSELVTLGDKLGIQLNSSRTHWAPARSLGPLSGWQRHLPWAVPLAVLFLTVIGLDFYWSAEPTEVVGPVKLPAAAVRIPRSEPVGPTTDSNVPRSQPAVQPSPLTPADGSLRGPAPGENEPPRTEPAPAAKSPANEPDTRAFWQSFIDPFGTGNLEQLRARVSEAASRAVRTSPGTAPAAPATDGPTSNAVSQPGPVLNVPPAARENVLVVGDEAIGGHTFASLHAACNVAKSGDVIELRFDGRRQERPIVISNIKLTIRAGERYQPVVVFRPEPDLVPLKYPPTMLSISGGQLYVTGVHWELDLPRNVPSDWALFETRGAELLQFQRCTFTIRNASLGQTAYHAGVAFFDIKSPAGAGGMAMDVDAMEQQILTINLQHCLARGEAAFLRANDLQAVRLNWDNGLFASSERLLTTAGGPSQPRQLGHVQINLRHVTAMVLGGLALLINSEDAPYQLLTEINSDDSIIVSTATSPLVEQRGSNSAEEFRSRLQWSGSRDFFDGIDVFWQIQNTAGLSAPKQMRFDDWQTHWGGQSRSQTFRKNHEYWRRLPEAERPFHSHVAGDYELDRSLTNPAIGGGSDGMDAGCLLKQLPTLVAPSSDEAKPRLPRADDKLDSVK